MKNFIFCCVLIMFISHKIIAQQSKYDDIIMFYNLENLFDPINDPHTQDDDFTPEGRYKWTWAKLKTKNNAIAKTIIAAGDGNAPTLIGVCEVENRTVLNMLIQQTPLAKIGYSIVHKDSPDPRGIDVALLYRTENFTVLDAKWFRVYYDSGNYRTREILYTKGVLHGLDTLHVFVNHWPSKLGGAVKSEPRRMKAAETLRAVIDSIFNTNKVANILVMGDFNDTPNSNPITKGLRAVKDTVCLACLYDMMSSLAKKGEGTLKYRKRWELIDMFFVSGNLLDTLAPIYCVLEEVKIFNAGFLLKSDEKYLGSKVHRTYEGYKYTGGASDHLPIVLRIKHGY